LPLGQNQSSCENHSFENVFRLKVDFYANQTHVHMKGFARRLVLKPAEVQGNSEMASYIRRTTISKTRGKATKSPCDPHRSLDRHRSQFCISTHLTISPCGSREPQTYQFWNRIPSSPDARKFQLSIPVSIWWVWAQRWLGFWGLGAKLVKCQRQWWDKSWSTWFAGNLVLTVFFVVLLQAARWF